MLVCEDDCRSEWRTSGHIDAMLVEALHLVADTKRYLETRSSLSPASVVHLSHLSEVERIAARLGSVVAWLLACKADRSGRPAGQSATGERIDLGADAACLEQPALHHLPAALRCLLEESAALYGRAIRIATSGSDRMLLN